MSSTATTPKLNANFRLDFSNLKPDKPPSSTNRLLTNRTNKSQGRKLKSIAPPEQKYFIMQPVSPTLHTIGTEPSKSTVGKTNLVHITEKLERSKSIESPLLFQQYPSKYSSRNQMSKNLSLSNLATNQSLQISNRKQSLEEIVKGTKLLSERFCLSPRLSHEQVKLPKMKLIDTAGNQYQFGQEPERLASDPHLLLAQRSQNSLTSRGENSNIRGKIQSPYGLEGPKLQNKINDNSAGSRSNEMLEVKRKFAKISKQTVSKELKKQLSDCFKPVVDPMNTKFLLNIDILFKNSKLFKL